MDREEILKRAQSHCGGPDERERQMPGGSLGFGAVLAAAAACGLVRALNLTMLLAG